MTIITFKGNTIITLVISIKEVITSDFEIRICVILVKISQFQEIYLTYFGGLPDSGKQY